MGKRYEKRGNGAAIIDEHPMDERLQVASEAERAPEEAPVDATADDTAGAAEMPLTAQPGEQEPPQDEPGPEDFERHTGSRLVSDHEADLLLLEQVKKRIDKREEVIGSRLRAKGAHATIFIGGREYVARQKPNSGGRMGIAKVGPRVATSLDG